MMKFQYYSNRVNSNKPQGFVTIDQFIEATRNPKNRDIFEAISDASARGDMKLKAKLKQENLYYFTPSVIVEGGRCYENVQSLTGLLVLDFDKIDNAEEFKTFLFNEFPFVICSYLSPSKRGVKALVSIPRAETIDQYKEYHYALEQTMECFDGYDSTTKNAVLPLFQSYDKDILHRTDYTTFSERLQDPNKLVQHREFTPVESTEFDALRVIAMFNSAIDKINDEGHPQLRGACLVLGGYVASGYVTFNDAESLAYAKIDSNAYLCQKKRVYKQTATWAIKKGMQSQLILN